MEIYSVEKMVAHLPPIFGILWFVSQVWECETIVCPVFCVCRRYTRAACTYETDTHKFRVPQSVQESLGRPKACFMEKSSSDEPKGTTDIELITQIDQRVSSYE